MFYEASIPAIIDKLSQIDDKNDKILALLNDRLPKENPENLMSWRVAALKKLERTQKNIDGLINTIENFKKGLLVKEHIDGTMALFNNEMPTTLDEYEQSHTLHLDYIIKHLTDIRNNIFKE